MTFFAFNNPQPNQPSPGSITLYLNAGAAHNTLVWLAYTGRLHV
jgi:hypothetical protein